MRLFGISLFATIVMTIAGCGTINGQEAVATENKSASVDTLNVCPAPVSFNGLRVFKDVTGNRTLYLLNAHANWDNNPSGKKHDEICLSKQNGDLMLIYRDPVAVSAGKWHKKVRFETTVVTTSSLNFKPVAPCPQHATVDSPKKDYRDFYFLEIDTANVPEGCQYKVNIFEENEHPLDPHISVGK